MRISPNVPIQVFSASLLDPNGVNQNTQYVNNALRDVVKKRYAHSVFTYPFYSDSSFTTRNLENRSYRITPPVNILLERSFFNFYGSGSLEVSLHLMNNQIQSTSSTPPLVLNPIHKFDCSTTGSLVKKSANVFPVLLLSGSTYQFETTLAVGSTMDYGELVVHLRADRFHTGSVVVDLPDNLGTDLFEEDDLVDADEFNNNVSEFLLQSQLNVTGTNNQTAMKAMFYVVRDLASTLTGSHLRFPVPRVNPTHFNSKIVYAQTFSDLTASNGALVPIEFRLVNNANKVEFSSQANIVVGGVVGASNRICNTVLTSSQNQASSTGSLDYTAQFLYSYADATLYKQYGYFWIE